MERQLPDTALQDTRDTPAAKMPHPIPSPAPAWQALVKGLASEPSALTMKLAAGTLEDAAEARARDTRRVPERKQTSEPLEEATEAQALARAPARALARALAAQERAQDRALAARARGPEPMTTPNGQVEAGARHGPIAPKLPTLSVTVGPVAQGPGQAAEVARTAHISIPSARPLCQCSGSEMQTSTRSKWLPHGTQCCIPRKWDHDP